METNEKTLINKLYAAHDKLSEAKNALLESYGINAGIDNNTTLVIESHGQLNEKQISDVTSLVYSICDKDVVSIKFD